MARQLQRIERGENEEARRLLTEYEEIFIHDGQLLGHKDEFQQKIPTGNAEPIKQRP